ncbi:MAG: O-antigen ligase family protein, partial [Gammaproteobacteria bacterium]|nr:O-antigen ligase family protein [Gammaproteobacteria bacterium]
RIIVLSVAVSCLPTVLGKAQLAQDGRSVGLLADPNYFALLIVVATPLALLLLRQERHRLVQLFWLIPLGIMAAGLMKTESRSAIVVLLLVLSALGWHYRHSLRRIQPRHLGLVFVAGALAFPIALAVMPKSFIERLESLTALASGVRAYEDGSLGRRASYLFVGAQMLKANPVLGAGPGTFPVFYAHTGYAVAFSYSKNNPDLFRRAHNTYLEVISETGIAGTLTFGTVILLALLNFHRARRLAQSLGDRADAEQITHFGLAFLALVLFLMFLSAPDHKYLWIMLALSGILRQTRQYRVEQERMP